MNPISSIVVLLVLTLFVKQGQFYKLPNLSNGTKDESNLEIVNGHITEHGNFPYQVSLFVATDEPTKGAGLICGGVIMNKDWIVTAAHCVLDDNGQTFSPDIVEVRVGIDKLHGDPNLRSNTYYASEVYANPDYKPRSYFNDVALIKVRDSIQLTDDIKAACFDYSESQYNYMIVTGYGKVEGPVKDANSGEEIESGKQGNELKYAYVKEDRNADFCDGITKVCLLPYYDDSGDSSCNGDSAPGKQVVGVFSTIHPRRSGDDLYYCVGMSQYTRLSRFRNWIDQYVGNNYCWDN